MGFTVQGVIIMAYVIALLSKNILLCQFQDHIQTNSLVVSDSFKPLLHRS